MLRIYILYDLSGRGLLLMDGHVPTVLCAWFSGYTAAISALYGGGQMPGSGLYAKHLRNNDLRKLSVGLKRVAAKYPELVVLQERE